MSYYTYFELTAMNMPNGDYVSNKVEDSIMRELYPKFYSVSAQEDIEANEIEADEDGFISFAVLEEDNFKWYDHERDMLEISRKYPDVLLILHGTGEEHDDIWIKYFMNGDVQVAPGRIEYDEFDPTYFDLLGEEE